MARRVAASSDCTRSSPSRRGAPSGWKKSARVAGNSVRPASGSASRSASMGPRRTPSSARRMAGAMTSARERVPWRRSASSIAATMPGTPIAPYPDGSPPPTPTWAMKAAGKVTDPSIPSTRPSGRWMRSCARPPRPDMLGSATARAKAVATAASTAFPPTARMPAPAAVAAGWAAATIPWAERATCRGGPSAPSAAPDPASEGPHPTARSPVDRTTASAPARGPARERRPLRPEFRKLPALTGAARRPGRPGSRHRSPVAPSAHEPFPGWPWPGAPPAGRAGPCPCPPLQWEGSRSPLRRHWTG